MDFKLNVWASKWPSLIGEKRKPPLERVKKDDKLTHKSRSLCEDEIITQRFPNFFFAYELCKEISRGVFLPLEVHRTLSLTKSNTWTNGLDGTSFSKSGEEKKKPLVGLL